MESFKSSSSWIDRVEYYKKELKMTIFLKNGGKYNFAEVPNNIYVDFMSATSHGEYYNNYIKNKYEDINYKINNNKDVFDLKIENSGNIKSCDLAITKNKINLIYGKNGEGKSIIAKSIYSKAKGEIDPKLKPLVDTWGESNIALPPGLGVSLFNTDFIENVVFKDSVFFKNSKELFLKDKKFIEIEKNLEENIKFLKKLLLDDELLEFFNSIENLSMVKLGNRTNKYYKNIIKENPMLSSKIPHKIREVRDGRADKVSEWGKWWQDGAKKYIDKSALCPFCGNKFSDIYLEKINLMKEILDKSNFEVRAELISYLKIVYNKTNIDTSKVINIINTRKSVDSSYNKKHITSLLKSIDKLKCELDKVKNIENNVNLFEKMEKIDMSVIDKLKGFPNLITLLNEYNNNLTKINSLVKSLQKKAEKIFLENIEIANNFCEFSGINYFFDKQENKIILKHIPSDKKLDDACDYFSYGEKNAISLLLFVLLNKNKEGSLIIFDDPISSYDDSKKIALLNLLFHERKCKCVKKNTLLFLTHDIDVLIELMLIRKREWEGICYLIDNINGDIQFQEIKKENIKDLRKNLFDIMNASTLNIVKIIYFRKLIECGFIKDKKDLVYHYISSIFKNKIPKYKGKEFSDVEMEIVKNVLKDEIKDFSFEGLIDEIENLNGLCEKDLPFYEKRILLRYLIFKAFGDEKANYPYKYLKIKPFIDDNYHVESLKMLSLEFKKYDEISKYINEIVDELLISFKLV